MVSANFQAIIGAILSDPTFDMKLLANPTAALERLGIQPTEELLRAWQNVDPETLKSLAAAFGDNAILLAD